MRLGDGQRGVWGVMKKAVLLWISASLFIMSCGNYRDVKTTFNEKSDGKVIETEIDFATIKKEILGPKCIGCHTGRHTAYESYSIVRASLDSILDRVTTQNPALRMPKDGAPLTALEIGMLREWIQAGAPEFNKKETKKENSHTQLCRMSRPLH